MKMQLTYKEDKPFLATKFFPYTKTWSNLEDTNPKTAPWRLYSNSWAKIPMDLKSGERTGEIELTPDGTLFSKIRSHKKNLGSLIQNMDRLWQMLIRHWQI